MKKLISVLLLSLLSTTAFAVEKSNTLHLILIDETGSMSSRKSEASKNLNTMLRGLRNSGKNIVLARFDTAHYKYEYGETNGVPDVATGNRIKEILDYSPGAATNLFDSIARLALDGEKLEKQYKRVTLTICTDGEENSSKLYTEESLKVLLDRKTKTNGWKLNYVAIKLDPMDETAWRGGVTSGLVRMSDSSGGQFVSSDASMVFTTNGLFDDKDSN